MTSKERVLAIYPGAFLSREYDTSINPPVLRAVIVNDGVGRRIAGGPSDVAAWEAAWDQTERRFYAAEAAAPVAALVKAAEDLLANPYRDTSYPAFTRLASALAPFRPAEAEVILWPSVGGRGVEIVGGKPKADPPVIELRREGSRWTASVGAIFCTRSDPDQAVSYLRSVPAGLKDATVIYVPAAN